MTYRIATDADCTLLGELNQQLIRDEGHRNPMSAEELRERIREWLKGQYRAAIFEQDKALIGYALFREELKEIYLRQLFICREHRRRGFGRKAMNLLKNEMWPKDKRLTVEVLLANQAAVRFWRAMGYKDYALTLEIMPSTG